MRVLSKLQNVKHVKLKMVLFEPILRLEKKKKLNWKDVLNVGWFGIVEKTVNNKIGHITNQTVPKVLLALDFQFLLKSEKLQIVKHLSTQLKMHHDSQSTINGMMIRYPKTRNLVQTQNHSKLIHIIW